MNLHRCFHRHFHHALRARSYRALIACCAFAGAAHSGFVAAQDHFPDHTLHLVVGYSAGGGVDAVARLLAPRWSTILGQEVVVDNRTGATGTIAAALVARSKPDGYTLFLGDSSTLIAPFLQKSPTFDPLKSFAPVVGTFTLPLLINATDTFPAHDPKELVAAESQAGFQRVRDLGRRHRPATRLHAVRVASRRECGPRAPPRRVADPAGRH